MNPTIENLFSPGKPTVEDVLQFAKQHERLQAECAALAAAVLRNEQALESLEIDGDLNHGNVVAEIVNRRALAGLYPRRVSDRQNRLAKSEDYGAILVEQFRHYALLPLVNSVSAAIARKQRPNFEKLLGDESAIDAAVQATEPMVRAQALLDETLRRYDPDLMPGGVAKRATPS